MTTKHYLLNTLIPSVFYGAVTGIITGAVIWGYSFLAEEILSLSATMYQFVASHLAFLPLLIVGLIAIGALSYFNTVLSPEVKGGGVPYIEGASRGILPLKWYKVAPGAIAGSFMSFICGLPLGSEGPSVLIGGALGSGVNEVGGKFDKKRKAWSTLTVTAGASAGFATALGAPLAGILFALEECHKKFSPVVLVTSAVAVLFAAITSGLLRIATGMGEHALFSFTITGFGVTMFYLPLIAGIVAGLAATGFSRLLNLAVKLMGKIKLPRMVKVIIAFVISGLSCLFFVDLVGGGAGIIGEVGNMRLEWQMILILLAFKLVLIILCSSAEVSGGMFIPLLCLGALTGGLIAKVMVLCGMSETYYSMIVVITMCAFLGSLLKAPITATVLTVELAGGVSSLLVSLVGIVAAYLITELFHTKAIYDEALERIIDKRRVGRELRTVKFEMKVMADSYAEDKLLRDIPLPREVVFAVNENVDNSTDPDLYVRGERILKCGDTVLIEARTTDEAKLGKALDDLFGEPDKNQEDKEQ